MTWAEKPVFVCRSLPVPDDKDGSGISEVIRNGVKKMPPFAFSSQRLRLALVAFITADVTAAAAMDSKRRHRSSRPADR